jgi:NAD(P)H dehydrogenase (quinone)
MPEHAATERYLAETGTPFTSLRNGFYATSPTLGDLLGRPAAPLSSFLEGVAAAH